MTDNGEDAGWMQGKIDIVKTPLITVYCPYCDRSENFEHNAGARAWIVGHVQEEHTDELPDFENGGGND